MKKIRIVEVGLRDGLQNEQQILSLSTKLNLIDRLIASGIKDMELGAFVSPKWVPQMSDSKKVINRQFAKNKRGMKYSALVPNIKGMENALETNIKEVSLFTACTDSFCKKNINCTVEESFQRFEEVARLAKKNKIRIRGYLSASFGCPYEGEVKAAKVVKYTKRLLALGCYEVSIGDTIGIANPKQTEKLTKHLLKYFPKKKIAMHFHDTRGMALANIVKSLEAGISSFDSSIGGLGGCPYAKGASGNVATEDVVNMLHEMGYDTGIELRKLIQTAQWLQSKMKRKLPAKLSKIPLA